MCWKSYRSAGLENLQSVQKHVNSVFDTASEEAYIMNGGPVHVEVLIRGARPTQAFKVGNPWCSAVAKLLPCLAVPAWLWFWYLPYPAITSKVIFWWHLELNLELAHYDLLCTLTHQRSPRLLTPWQDCFLALWKDLVFKCFQDHPDQVRQKWLQTPQLTLLARLHKVKCNAFAGDITISVHCCPSFHLKHGNVDLFRAFKTERLIDQHDVW